MKKGSTVLLIAIVALVLSSCSSALDPGVDAEVRFQNLLTDGGVPWDLGYGVRYGDAVHEGYLAAGSATPYYPVSEGSYSIMMKTFAGDWITVSAGSLPSPTEDGHYTISLQGDWSYGTVWFAATRDY